MAEPQYGERVPYVITRGEPGSRLVDRAAPPDELLKDRYAVFESISSTLVDDICRHKNIDEAYYITHMLIPPLERIFNLVGANVQQWFEDMPKPARSVTKRASSIAFREGEIETNDRYNIDGHFRKLECAVCKQPSDAGQLGFRKIDENCIKILSFCRRL